MQFQLRGAPAIVVAAVVVLAGGGSLLFGNRTLDADAREWIARELKSEILRNAQPGIETAHATGRSHGAAARSTDAVQRMEAFEITEIRVRGRGKKCVARVRFVDGTPGVVHTRYFRCSYSSLTGWQVKRETSAFSYWSRLF